MGSHNSATKTHGKWEGAEISTKVNFCILNVIVHTN